MKKLFMILLFVTFSVAAYGQQASGKVFWRGMVDDRVQLVIHVDQIETKTVSGREMPEGTFSFTTPLPDSPVTVSVLKKKGRSKQVTVVQQPTDENGFTAIVEIYDGGGGAKEYQLEISWN